MWVQEMYLIDSRFRKVPYKLIATQLCKTELACRLHYHQLGVPRRRTLSVSSSASSLESIPGLKEESEVRPLFGRFKSSTAVVTNADVLTDSTPPPQLHNVPNLLKQISSHTPNNKRLRLDTTNLCSQKQHSIPSIDHSRLHRIYETRRSDFWSQVAKDYGSNIAPAALEHAWTRFSSAASGVEPLPTPCVSPKSDTAAPSILAPTVDRQDEGKCLEGFTAINQTSTAGSVVMEVEKSALAISALLNDEERVDYVGRFGI